MRYHYKVASSDPKPCYNTKKLNPIQCESCYLHSNQCDSCQQLPGGVPPPYPDSRWSYCPAESDSGLLHTLRNGFQRIFNGNRKRGCNTACDPAKGRVYTYTRSQLKNLDHRLDKVEEETSCIDWSIKEAFSNDCSVNISELRCFLTTIIEQLEGIKYDLCCAADCYDPCRDRCEHDMISSMLERVSCLESCANDICLQVDGLMCKNNSCKTPVSCDISCRRPCCNKLTSNKNKVCCCKTTTCKTACETCNISRCTKPCCYKVTRAPECRKPCCVKKTVCEVNCQKQCCAKLPTCDNRKLFAKTKWRPNGRTHKTDLCRTSSVIPVGVMLVKL